MDQTTFDRNKEFSFSNSISYSEGAIVSKKVIANKGGNVSLFAFEKGEGLSEHSAPFDALVQVVDGKANIIIDGKLHEVENGSSIIMPANIPHALEASERFKMILTMIKD